MHNFSILSLCHSIPICTGSPQMCIRDLVDQALTTGLLTLEAEAELRILLSKKYGYDDLKAFMVLQSAAMTGQVEQESRFLGSVNSVTRSTSLSSPTRSVRSPRLEAYC